MTAVIEFVAKCAFKIEIDSDCRRYDGTNNQQNDLSPEALTPYPFCPIQFSSPNFVSMVDSPGFKWGLTGGTPPFWSKVVAHQFFKTAVVCNDDYSIKGARFWGQYFIKGSRYEFGSGKNLTANSPSPRMMSFLSAYGYKWN